jgi:hypothetical protein
MLHFLWMRDAAVMRTEILHQLVDLRLFGGDVSIEIRDELLVGGPAWGVR